MKGQGDSSTTAGKVERFNHSYLPAEITQAPQSHRCYQSSSNGASKDLIKRNYQHTTISVKNKVPKLILSLEIFFAVIQNKSAFIFK